MPFGGWTGDGGREFKCQSLQFSCFLFGFFTSAVPCLFVAADLTEDGSSNVRVQE
jgi:hypothetical protein